MKIFIKTFSMISALTLVLLLCGCSKGDINRVESDIASIIPTPSEVFSVPEMSSPEIPSAIPSDDAPTGGGLARNVPTAAQLKVIENELIRLTGNLNKKLKFNNKKLTRSSSIRSAEIQRVFSHTRPNGKNCFNVFQQTGFSNYNTVGENIAKFSLSANTNAALKKCARQIFNGWKKSPGHYKNMINKKFNKCGISCSARKEAGMIKVSACQLFAG